MVQQVWQDKGLPDGTINKEVTNEFAKRLYKGVEKGYGKQLTKVDYDSPDFNMLAALQRNCWQFSAAKNYTQLRELGNALLDDNGKLRTYKEFEKAALAINNKHVKKHLKAEYNLAVAGGQMAGKWAEFDDNAMLQFDAVIDGRTTALCARLHGTTLPKEHPFWKTYYPPNHWGCRSNVIQVYGMAATKDDNIESADIPKMFQTNLGEKGLVFPANHSYFKDIPNNVALEAMKIMPYDTQFKILHQTEQGYVRQHFLITGLEDDYNEISKIAFEKAKEGRMVDIMPTLDTNGLERDIIFPDAKKRKSPDLRIDGVLHEVESPTSKSYNNVWHSVGEGLKQANNVIIFLNEEFSEHDMFRIANGRFVLSKGKKDIEIIFRTITGRYITFAN